ncbi:hypothetical protein GCM10010112_74800 [Actinoplanes lobatus]|uniref:Cytoskeletal protein RodZ n=1 Tax=Actinoplanes lobatus TaxID=113568 RepID=A0A7W7MF00_9ACTN|nr:hypothetical protein [Actinoplanes lobatus]MBB4747814.1 cytoskeletal protein RodZ [Actinoplanes lobatus]GGN89905.1 hypothetical protein GCM10010112_74800 [Actinoplanes lobatus]GIE43755.1 hypothetical protein Alo02nite_66530 [Actinoplanes lobatus]
MRRTYRRPGQDKRKRNIVIGAAVAVLVGGGLAVGTGLSSASTFCDGLDERIRETQQFMAQQRANPNSQTEAILANRQAVIDLINVQKAQGGCGGAQAQAPAAKPTTTAPAAKPTTAAPAAKPTTAAPAAKPTTAAPAAKPTTAAPAGNGQVVCPGSTVTLSGEGGAAAASSGTHPVGTVLRVRNLDNNKSITVTVTSVSGSCVLLNNAAFEEVREPGKFLIRRAVIERVG